jgi:hypothetical protein
MNHPRILLIVAALFMALITGVNFSISSNSGAMSFAAASMSSGGSAGTSQSGGGGW